MVYTWKTYAYSANISFPLIGICPCPIVQEHALSSSLNNVPFCPAHIPFWIVTILSQNRNVPSSTIFNALQLLYYVLLCKHAITIILLRKQNRLPCRTNITFWTIFVIPILLLYSTLLFKLFTIIAAVSQCVISYFQQRVTTQSTYYLSWSLLHNIKRKILYHCLLFFYYYILHTVLLELFATITCRRRRLYHNTNIQIHINA